MATIQIKLNEQEEEIINIYKAKNRLSNKSDAIKAIIMEYSKKPHIRTKEEKLKILKDAREEYKKLSKGKNTKLNKHGWYNQ